MRLDGTDALLLNVYGAQFTARGSWFHFLMKLTASLPLQVAIMKAHFFRMSQVSKLTTMAISLHPPQVFWMRDKGWCTLNLSTLLPTRSAGAYGSAFDAEWDSDAIALLDRGFIYAIAAVRGGGELGQFWYEGGRGMAKNNTFADTIAAARHLIAARPSAHRALPACMFRHAGISLARCSCWRLVYAVTAA